MSTNDQFEALAEKILGLYHTSETNVHRRRDYVEVALAVASVVGEQAEKYVSEIEEELSSDAKRRVSLTKIESGPIDVQPRREQTPDGNWRTHQTLFRAWSPAQEAARLCDNLDLSYASVADAVDQLETVKGPWQVEALAKRLREIFRNANSTSSGQDQGGDGGVDHGPDGNLGVPPNGCSSITSDPPENPDSKGSDRKSVVDQSLAKGSSDDEFRKVGTRQQRRFLDHRSRMRAERLLFLHLLGCMKAGNYGTGDDSWSVVPSETIRNRFEGPRATYLVWQGSDLIRCRDGGWYAAPHEHQQTRAREMRVPENVLDKWTELGKGTRRWRLDTPRPERTSEPAPMCTDLSDDDNHRYPNLVDSALRVLADANHVVDLDAIVEAEEMLLRCQGEEVRRKLYSLRMAQETIERQSEGDAKGMTSIRNAYEVQELSGRIFFKNGGPLNLPVAVKQRAYAHYNNYDIASCHTAALKEIADELQTIGVEIDTSPLDEYSGKYVLAEELDLPPALVKFVEHAVKYGAYLPCSISQANVVEDETGHRPEIADAAEKYSDCPDQVLSELHEVFSPIREMVKEVEEAILGPYWHERKQPGGPIGSCMKNACGIVFRPDEWPPGHVRESKAMAWMLQGLEAAFVHSITVLSQDHDYEVIANEHDGAIVDGVIPETAIDEAREISGFSHAEFVQKDFASEKEVEEIYGDIS